MTDETISARWSNHRDSYESKKRCPECKREVDIVRGTSDGMDLGLRISRHLADSHAGFCDSSLAPVAPAQDVVK